MRTDLIYPVTPAYVLDANSNGSVPAEISSSVHSKDSKNWQIMWLPVVQNYTLSHFENGRDVTMCLCDVHQHVSSLPEYKVTSHLFSSPGGGGGGGGLSTFFQVGVCGPDLLSVGLVN